MKFPLQCSHQDRAEIHQTLLEELSLRTPDIHLYASPMAQLSAAIRRREQERFCVLPFCHTVEGSALSACIRYSDPTGIPLAGDRMCKTAKDVLALLPMDFSGGRIPQVLEACLRLSRGGEIVMLNLNGPLTVLNTLMDTMDLLSLLMENPPELTVLLGRLKDSLLRYMQLAANAGVRVISYADALSAADLLGPELAAQLAERFTIPFLSASEQLLSQAANRKTVLSLCPKTAQSLAGHPQVSWQEFNFPDGTPYAEALSEATATSLVLAGPCIKILQKHNCPGLSALRFAASPPKGQ